MKHMKMNHDPEYDKWLDLLDERDRPWENDPVDPNYPPELDRDTDPF